MYVPIVGKQGCTSLGRQRDLLGCARLLGSRISSSAPSWPCRGRRAPRYKLEQKTVSLTASGSHV